VEASPSWVTDGHTEDIYKQALAKNVSPRTLLSRIDTELFLLNIASDSVSDEGMPRLS